MPSNVTRSLLAAALAVVTMALVLPTTEAFHFYRGPGSGCTPAVGALGDAPVDGGATVLVLHNTFNDASTALPVTAVSVGDSITWTWNSEHCHSVRAIGGAFYSGFHYPAPTPSTPLVVPGFAEYPVPTLEPQLSFTVTFTEPGTYPYECEHHTLIGMRGVVVVQ